MKSILWPPLLERDDPFKDMNDDEIFADILEVLRVWRQPCQRIWVHRWPAVKKCPRHHDSWPRSHRGIHWQTWVDSQVNIFITWKDPTGALYATLHQRSHPKFCFSTQPNATRPQHSHPKQGNPHSATVATKSNKFQELFWAKKGGGGLTLLCRKTTLWSIFTVCVHLQGDGEQEEDGGGVYATGGKADGAPRKPKVPGDPCEQVEGGLGGEHTF